MHGVKGRKIADTRLWQTYYFWPSSSSLVAGIAISAGHSRCRVGRMRRVLTAERSSLTIALRLVATSQNENRILVIAESPCIKTPLVFLWFKKSGRSAELRRGRFSVSLPDDHLSPSHFFWIRAVRPIPIGGSGDARKATEAPRRPVFHWSRTRIPFHTPAPCRWFWAYPFITISWGFPMNENPSPAAGTCHTRA